MNELILKKIKNKINLNKINVFGIHGPQGIGKTTIKEYLRNELLKEKIESAIFSIDDFYLEYQSMKSFLNYANNKLYKFRGLAGTHDIDLLYIVLDDLINKRDTYMPKFDKLLEGSFGDRSGYENISNKPIVVILEGWMIGYIPLKNPTNEISFFNDELKKYSKIQNLVSHWIYLDTNNYENVYKWRWSAEDKNGMDEETFYKFMQPYLKIYENYKIDDKNKIVVDFDRNII